MRVNVGYTPVQLEMDCHQLRLLVGGLNLLLTKSSFMRTPFIDNLIESGIVQAFTPKGQGRGQSTDVQLCLPQPSYSATDICASLPGMLLNLQTKSMFDRVVADVARVQELVTSKSDVSPALTRRITEDGPVSRECASIKRFFDQLRQNLQKVNSAQGQATRGLDDEE